MPVVDFRGANGSGGHQPYPINHNLRKVAFLGGTLGEPYIVSPPNFFFKPLDHSRQNLSGSERHLTQEFSVVRK